MRIGICDDNELYLDYLYTKVTDWYANNENVEVDRLTPNQLMIKTKTSGDTFPYDVLITDIEMGNLNGIQIAKEINEIQPACIIIFISNYINYAMDVYDTKHIYFILKTEAEVRLPKALDKAYSIYRDNQSSRLSIEYQGVVSVILMSDILYVEALGRYLHIHSNKHSFKCIRTLKSIIPELNDTFIRCHKSYIVNLNYVASINRKSCTLTNGMVIGISCTYYKNFNEAYIQYVSHNLR